MKPSINLHHQFVTDQQLTSMVHEKKERERQSIDEDVL